MKRRTGMVATLAVLGSFASTSPAVAQSSPQNCTANRFVLDIITDKTAFRIGDTIRYTVQLSNLGADGCDVSNISANFRYPGPDGKASGPVVALTNAARFNVPTNTVTFGPFSHVAVVNNGVPGLVANVSMYDGILHDPLNTELNIDKNISSILTVPVLSLDKIGSITSGQAPQNVQYTFLVTNTSLTPVAMDRVTVVDDKCGNPVYAGGDDGDGFLSNNETWTYTCSMLHQAPGVYTNTANACAYSRVPGDTTRPVCSPPDTWTVTLDSPPPQTSVLPANVTQPPPCTIKTQSRLRVRAGQVNTIRVTARTDAPVSGKRVTVRLPGGPRVSATTNSRGVATIRVTPRRSGRATITAPDCGRVQVTVRAARKVQSRQVPRVTG